MSLPLPAMHCSICGVKLFGRSDKIFCSIDCKNQYHKLRRSEHVEFSNPIDKMLHRNWVILTEFHELAGKKKFFVSKADLNRAGFHSKYYTTSQTNTKDKTYFYVYNYGWMDFSESQMMVVRLAKPK